MLAYHTSTWHNSTGHTNLGATSPSGSKLLSRRARVPVVGGVTDAASN